VTRITVDLDPPVHATLNLWMARNAATIGTPQVKLAEVIAAMVVTTARYQDVTDTVCSQIRDQRAAARERGERGERGRG
jgi:hypothetical protein